MVKKKNKLKTIPSSAPLPSPKKIHTGFFSSWWDEPFVSTERYYGILSRIGIGISMVLFLATTAYFVKGNWVRPRILDSNFVTRILQSAENPDVQLFRVGPVNSFAPAEAQDGKKGLYFRFGGEQVAGFVVSRNLLKIPDDAQNFGISISCAYKGNPTLIMGFPKQEPVGNIENWKPFIERESGVTKEFPPSQDSMRFFLTLATTYYKPEDFSLPWNQAKYAFFVFQSPVPTELFLENIVFVEKR